MLFTASPGFVLTYIVIQIAVGLAVPAVAWATGSLVGHARGLAAGSASARSGAVTALILLAIALVVTNVLGSATQMLHTIVAYRFGAVLEAMRMSAVGRLPGLVHFETPGMADNLQAARWARPPSDWINMTGSSIRWVSMCAGGVAVASQIAWWAPLIIVAAVLPTAINHWRHTGEQTSIQFRNVAGWRHASYAEQLSVGLQPAREVRMFGLGRWLLDRQQRQWTDAMTPLFDDKRRQVRQNLLISSGQIAVSAVPYLAAFAFLMDGRLSLGAFSKSILALGAVSASARFSAQYPAEIRQASRFLPELFALIDLPSTDPGLPATTSPKPAPSKTPEIRFEGVRFTYPGTGMLVLDGLDLVVPAGSTMALVGPNGAGKTTLVKLLCRFYDPDEGRVLIDGVDLRDFDVTEIRRRFAVVFQDFLRLPMSALENVGVGCLERSSERELIHAAAATTGASHVVEGLANGWDSILAREFDGVDLSGGEWQRLALARAIMARDGRGASVLILDEPTASLDVRLEHELFQQFATLTEGLTTLLISHRFSTVRMADRVAVLDAGRIVELGSHEELVDARGRYWEMYELQARRFRESGELE